MWNSCAQFFPHDGLNFRYIDTRTTIGDGIPFIFQHGLGGDLNQPCGLFKPPSGFRLISFDCRAHGETYPLGDAKKIGIASFADDMAALMDYLGIPKAIIGGISMGAAVALNFALRSPERIFGLVLSRPAWLDGPMPRNVKIYRQVAQLIREHGAKRGLGFFKQTEDYAETSLLSPDAANSLIGQFENPRAEEAVIRLERIPKDAPVSKLSELNRIEVPTLVLANRQDPIHPFEYGEILAKEIPKAQLKELTPKSVSKERHAEEGQKFIGEFVNSIQHSAMFCRGARRCAH